MKSIGKIYDKDDWITSRLSEAPTSIDLLILMESISLCFSEVSTLEYKKSTSSINIMRDWADESIDNSTYALKILRPSIQ